MVITTSKAFRASFLSVLMIAVMACQVVFAADQHRLELKDIPDLVGAPELVMASEVAISPDGNWVAYTATTTSLTTRASRQRLWVQPFEDVAATQIGPQDADNSSPIWSPDSSKLLFSSASSGHTSVVIWNVADKTTRVIGISIRAQAEWLPDSTRFLVITERESADPTVHAADQKTPAPIVLTTSDTNRRLPQGHYIGDFSPAKGTDSFDFVLVDALTGTAKKVATNVDPNIRNYQISPDGTKLAYTVRKGEFDYDGNKRILHDVKVVDLESGSILVAASDVLGGFGFSPTWSHNGAMLAVIGGTFDDDDRSLLAGSPMFARPGHCYIVDLRRPGVLRRLGPRLFSRDFSPMWSDDDDAIYAVSARKDADIPAKIVKLTLATGAFRTVATVPLTRDVTFIDEELHQGGVYVTGFNGGGEKTQVFAFDLRSHEFKPILQARQSIGSLTISGAGTHIAYRAVDSSHPPNVWIWDRHAGEPRQLTDFGSGRQQQQKLGETKSLSWQFNGKTLYGTLWLPVNYQAGRRYPTIVEVYPAYQGSAVRNLFRGDPFGDSLIWQAFSASGYAVFWPDFNLRVGEGPHEIAAQIIPALDKIVELGIADPNGFGVYGRSWGGYSTFSLITETHRFKAAMTGSGYSNLFTACGDSYVLGLMENDDMGVSPWQNPTLYIKNSPYFSFARVTTPVLIQYGDKDPTFAYTSQEAFVALRRLGKTATLLGYPDDGHGVSAPENKVDFTNRALEWFDQYLKPSQEAHMNR